MKWWNNYWFRQAPLLDLALIRLVAVGVQLVIVQTGWLKLDNMAYLSGLPADMFSPLPIVKMYLLPFGSEYVPTLQMLTLVWWVTFVAGIMSFVGFRTNSSLVVFTLGSVFMCAYYYSFGEMHHPDAVVVIALSVLALSPSGKALSVDSIIKGRLARPQERLVDRTSAYAGWPILVIQWFFVLMYLSAGSHKMLVSGMDWMNGYTLQYYLIQEGLQHGSRIGLWLSQHHLFLVMAQWLVIFFQFTFSLAVIFPRLRWIYIPLGLTFHLAILLTLKAGFLTWIWLYAVFFPWSRVFRLLSDYPGLGTDKSAGEAA